MYYSPTLCRATLVRQTGSRMAPSTISPTDHARRVLLEVAERRCRSVRSIAEEGLERSGIRPRDTVEEIVARARASSGLDADEAMALAVEETRRFREGHDN